MKKPDVPLSDIQVRTGSFEGHPIYNTVTVSEQQEMLDAGLSMRDIYEIAGWPDQDWQADC